MFKVQVITVSDRCFKQERKDEGGPAVKAMLEAEGYEVDSIVVVPDEEAIIEKALCEAADKLDMALIVTTGGTGFAPRDVTPEATLHVCQKLVLGIPEAMRKAAMEITPRGMLSRGTAGIRGRSLIINLPGSPKAAEENLAAVLPAIEHGLIMLRGKPMDCAQLEPQNMK